MNIDVKSEKITLSALLEKILTRHGLKSTDGRHLYQYRITNTEFAELEEALRYYLLVGQVKYDLGELSKRSIFPMLFVLYGAEWWRRRYDGSGFTWEGILRDLGAKTFGWTQAQRSECVRNGLKLWKLSVLESSGFKFLGAIALEGGLPMTTLVDARGGIAYLLGRVLRTANNRTVILEDLQTWVESLQHHLPKSYRQTAIFTLLAETAWTVLSLKQKAQLDSGKEAVARLNMVDPDWRNRFPLPVEDRQAQSLIEQLMREAADVRVQKPTLCLPVDRFLEPVSDEEWALSSIIEIPDTIEAQKLNGLFEIETDDLRFAELSVTAGDKTRTTTIRKMAGNNSYRLEHETWDFIGVAAQDEHLLRLNSSDGREWMTAAMRGQALDDDLPWVFSRENSICRLVRQGAGSVANHEALAAVPQKWQVSESSISAAEKIGVLQTPPRDIYRVTETVYFEDDKGASCKINVASAQSETENYEWRGRRLWLDFLSPSVAFKGRPKLYRVDEEGNAIPATGTINCTALGSTVTNHWVGPVTLSYQPGGELKHKSRMVILPEDARLTLKFGDALSGTVIFSGWGAASAAVVTPDVNFVQRNEENALIVKLSIDPDRRVPDRVAINLFWRHSSTPVRISVPFPCQGVRAFDGRANEIHQGAQLATNQLIGVRFNVVGADPTKKIILDLQTQTGGLGRKHRLKPLPGALSFDVRLTDFLTDFDHLLSLDDSPDAKVKASLIIGDEEAFMLQVARYSNVIERDEDFVLIRSGERINEEAKPLTDELKVLAMRLEDPLEEPSVLAFAEESSGGESKWLFSPGDREPGTWLIYPDAASKITFRPTVWAIPGDFEQKGELAQVLSIADRFEREKAIKQMVKQLANDFAHPAWQEVSRLAELVGHLPLTTLDLWRRFARSAAGMAALAFRCGKLPVGFVSRFAKELPFAWEAIPFTVWKQAIKKSFEYCRQILPEDLAKMTFEAQVQRRINILAANHGGLSYQLGLASMEFFPETKRDAEALKSCGEILAQGRLFAGESSCLMNLRRNHFEEEWVGDDDKLLDERWGNTRIGRYRCPENYGYQNHVINAPLLLAAESAVGKSKSWLKDPAKIHLLRSFRAFDPEWFDEAYNWTIVRCLASGLIDDQPSEAGI